MKHKFPDLIVSTDIELHALKVKDAKDLFALTDKNRAHLRKWLPWVDATRTWKDSLKFIETSKEDWILQVGVDTAVVFHGELIGVLGMHSWDTTNRKCALGYWIDQDQLNKGIMTKCVKKLIAFCFKELKMNRIEIRAGVANKRSRAIPERLGFKKEGTAHQAEWLYDRYVDHTVYSLLKDDWK